MFSKHDLITNVMTYLATGNVGIARRSAVERGILMARNAPHLVRAMPQLVPLLPSMSHSKRALVRVPEPIEWDEKAKPVKTSVDAVVEEDGSGLTAH